MAEVMHYEDFKAEGSEAAARVCYFYHVQYAGDVMG